MHRLSKADQRGEKRSDRTVQELSRRTSQEQTQKGELPRQRKLFRDQRNNSASLESERREKKKLDPKNAEAGLEGEIHAEKNRLSTSKLGKGGKGA